MRKGVVFSKFRFFTVNKKGHPGPNTPLCKVALPQRIRRGDPYGILSFLLATV